MSETPFLAACVQLRGSSDVSRNLAVTEGLIRRAAGYGARLIATPEATTYLGPHARKIALSEAVDGPTNAHFGALAAELGVTLVLGGNRRTSRAKMRIKNPLAFLSKLT